MLSLHAFLHRWPCLTGVAPHDFGKIRRLLCGREAIAHGRDGLRTTTELPDDAGRLPHGRDRLPAAARPAAAVDLGLAALVARRPGDGLDRAALRRRRALAELQRHLVAGRLS